jgi:hypothetical protein
VEEKKTEGGKNCEPRINEHSLSFQIREPLLCGNANKKAFTALGQKGQIGI